MPSKKIIEPYKRYTDPTGEFSNRSLDAATWYLTHKTIVIRVGFFALAITALVFTIIAVAGWSQYVFVGMAEDKRLAAEQLQLFQNYEIVQATVAARPLTVTGLQVFTSAPDTYDLVASVENSNRDWIAHMTYYFSYSGGTTTLSQAILLPGIGARPVAALGQALLAYPADARLVLEHVDWERVNPHRVANIAGFITEHVSFEIDQLKFTHATPGSTGLPVHDLHFILKNTSAYSYWEPAFYVQLLRGGQPVGILYLTAERLRSLEERPIDLRIFASDITVDDVVLFPLVNPFDRSVYMAPAA